MKYKNPIFITIIILAVIGFASISIFGFIKISNRESVQINIGTENKIESEIKELRLIAPNGDEQLCLGDNFIVKWEGPSELRDISLVIRKEGDVPINSFLINLNPISTDDNEKQLNAGNFIWKVGYVESRYGSTEKPGSLVPGPAYEMFIRGTIGNQSLTDGSDQIFSILDCQK